MIDLIFNRRKVTARSCSWIFFAALLSVVRADPIPPTEDVPPPPLTTNSAATSFLQAHPEVTEPVPGNAGSLSLAPEPPSHIAPPQTNPDRGELFPTFSEVSPMIPASDLASHLLVVYNAKDRDSQGLALYYAQRRNIPAERVLAISCPVTEEITRAQFDDTIRLPIVTYLCQKNWLTRQPQSVRVGNRMLDLLVATHNDIWAIVLMRGVPLKIAADPSEDDGMESQPQFQTNAAAVDSELALLPVFGLPKGGFVPNIFFDDQVAGIKRVGPDLARSMVLVTRLDGPQVSDVRRMIDDCIAAEKNRLAGLAVVDSRGFTDVHNGYTEGDVWLRNARDSLVNDGWTVKFDDKGATLPATDPCNQVALYLGWYTETASGPWITQPNRFVPGAIAYHLHSFSASTVRSATSNWVGPLISHGADATMGMVYEPYLVLTPHLDIFTRRLLQGDYFAEAAYASEIGLSWMMTVVGDPLYRPFHEPLESAMADTSDPHSAHDDWLLLQKVQRQLLAGEIRPSAESMKVALDVPGAGPVAQEYLGDLLDKRNGTVAGLFAEAAYRKASAGDHAAIDRVRVGLKLAQHYLNHGQGSRAESQLASLRDLYGDDALRYGVADPLMPTSMMPIAIPLPAPSSGPAAGNTSSGSSANASLAPPRPPSLPKPTSSR